MQDAPVSPNSVLPSNRRTHYHFGEDLKAAQRCAQCLALRLEGLHLHEIAQRLGISKSAVHDPIEQAWVLARAADAKMDAQILVQEPAKWLDLDAGMQRHNVRTGRGVREAGFQADGSSEIREN